MGHFYGSAVLLGLLVVAQVCASANLLYISAVASPSHFLWSQRLSRALALRDHNVTLVNLYKQGSTGHIHFVMLDGVQDALDAEEADYLALGGMSPFMVYTSFAELELQICSLALQSTGLQFILNYPDDFRFDLVIHDHLAGPCLLLLMDRFNFPPLVMASAGNGLSSTYHFTGSPPFPGFIPNQMYDIAYDMSFVQRWYNFALAHWELFYRANVYGPQVNRLVSERFPQLATVSSFENRAAYVLLNSIPLLELPEPQIWKIINVGGLHIAEPKRLPSYLAQHKSNASQHVVYISFGSNVRADSLSNETLWTIISTMEDLQMVSFFWKVETNVQLPKQLSANVLTERWFPQNDLLGSGMVDLFLTHGGLLSVQEAVWHGVPMLGVPVFGDQFQNINQMERLGVARRLSLSQFNKSSLKDNLLDLLNDVRYQQRVRELSMLVRQAQNASLSNAVRVIELAQMHPNRTVFFAYELSSVPLWRKCNFDILVSVTVAVLFVVELLKRAIKLIYLRFACKAKLE